MARHRLHRCKRCGQVKSATEFVKDDPERSCYSCFRVTYDRYVAMKEEMRALIRKGVHPRMVERIMNVRIARGELTREEVQDIVASET